MTIAEIIKIFLVSGGFLLFFFFLNRLEKSRKFDSEINRKILHIGSGIGGIALPFVFKEKLPVVILGIFFLLLLAVIRRLKHKATGLKTVIEMKRRKTFGDIYFVTSILGLWIVSGEDRLLYSLPLVILMFSDAFAALIGEFYSKFKFDTGFGTKSIEGSIIFFLTTYFLCSNYFLLFSNIRNVNIVLLSLLLSILTMILEIISWNGLDNLFVPFFVYLFLKRNLYISIEELRYKFWVIVVLFVVILLNRKKTTLTRTAQTASLFFMYLVTTIGGIKWLVPPLIMYLGYYHFTPKVEGQMKDSLKGLLTIAFSTFIWLGASIIFSKEKLLIVYIFAFALHFSLINLIRYNAVYSNGKTFIMKFLYISMGKGIAFFFFNYFLFSELFHIPMIIGSIALLGLGLLFYELALTILYWIGYREKLLGEKKVFISSGVVFAFSTCLWLMGLFY